MSGANGLLSDLTRIQKARTGRVSSWDHTGKNQDGFLIPPGATVRLADIEGPGCITHMWMTQFCRRSLGPSLIDPGVSNDAHPVLEIRNTLGVNWEITDPFYYRKVLFKIYWDDQETPSVIAPLGDFFCIGHSMPGNFASLPMTVSSRPDERNRFGGTAALNCYFQMPFNKRAVIEVENQNDLPYGQFFHIDFELYDEPLAENVAYFHAHWRRNSPCDGWGPNLQVNAPEVNVANRTGKDNYTILETEGAGHYVGCNLSVAHYQGSWWGEGDEMIFIDDDTWPPTVHGTGSEDYFNHAWGMQNNAFPMNGSAIHESVVPGYQVSYRFHLTDPVRFRKRIKVTMEHGHANHLSDDWASTAYWYQTLPSPVLQVPAVEDRLPPVPGEKIVDAARAARLSPDERVMVERWDARFSAFVQARDAALERDYEATRTRSEANAKAARDLKKTL